MLTQTIIAPILIANAVAFTHTVTLVQGENGYTGFEDTSIFSENEFSGGGTDGIFSGTNGQFDTRRVLLRADLSMIPPGATITRVTLELTVDMSGDNFGDIDYTLHRITTDWGEGTVVGASEGGFGAPADPGDATWQSNFHTVSAWSNPGGDFDLSPSAITPAGHADSVAVWEAPGLTADVQLWVDDPSVNFGWMIVSSIEGEFKRVKKFHSSEAIAFRPVLTIDYVPPGVPLHAGQYVTFVTMIVIFAYGIQHLRKRRES